MGEEYKRETLRSYEKAAPFHARRFEGLFDVQRRDEFKLFLQCLKGRRVLDLGCGAGEHAAYFANQGLDVTAIDISPAMIALAKERSPALDARVMDMEGLDFPPSTFDGVWAVTSLLHVPKKNVPAVIESVAGVLKERGILYVCMKEGEGEGLEQDKHDPATRRYFAYWQREELKAVLEPRFTVYVDRVTPRDDRKFLEMLARKK
jgi:SAM-dependent methyltransferase